jgi:hypothetical protein
MTNLVIGVYCQNALNSKAHEYQSAKFCGRVAQWLEQGTHNSLVAGSSPAAPTIYGSVM